MIGTCAECGRMFEGAEEDVCEPGSKCPCCYRGIHVGDRVECVNADSHSWFLLVGAYYVVNEIRGSMIGLSGMAKMWPVRQFKLAPSDMPPTTEPVIDPADVDGWAEYVAKKHGWTRDHGWPR